MPGREPPQPRPGSRGHLYQASGAGVRLQNRTRNTRQNSLRADRDDRSMWPRLRRSRAVRPVWPARSASTPRIPWRLFESRLLRSLSHWASRPMRTPLPSAGRGPACTSADGPHGYARVRMLFSDRVPSRLVTVAGRAAQWDAVGPPHGETRDDGGDVAVQRRAQTVEVGEELTGGFAALLGELPTQGCRVCVSLLIACVSPERERRLAFATKGRSWQVSGRGCLLCSHGCCAELAR